MKGKEFSNIKKALDLWLESEDVVKIIRESTHTQTDGFDVDDGPATWYRSFNEYSKEVQVKAENLGFKIIGYLLSGGADVNMGGEEGDSLPVTHFPAGIGKGAIINTYRGVTGMSAYKKWISDLRRLSQILGWKFIEWIKENR